MLDRSCVAAAIAKCNAPHTPLGPNIAITLRQCAPYKIVSGGFAAKVILSGLAAKTILSGLAAKLISSGLAAKVVLSGLAAKTNLSGLAAEVV